MRSFLCQPRVLWISGVTYLCLTAAFGVVMWVWDFQIIDEMFNAEQILTHVAALTAEQKQVHIITTATLDVAYPFAYGFFQAGMAWRYLGRWGNWIAPLSLLCMPVDLAEGFAQVMILSDHSQFVALKTVATPVKLALYLPGLVGAVVALWIAARQHPRGEQNR